MAALVDIVRLDSTLRGFPLESQADMTTALTYLSERGYTGSTACQRVDGAVQWVMTLQDNAGTDVQIGYIGYWIVIENDTIASLVDPIKAAALYAVA